MLVNHACRRNVFHRKVSKLPRKGKKSPANGRTLIRLNAVFYKIVYLLLYPVCCEKVKFFMEHNRNSPLPF